MTMHFILRDFRSHRVFWVILLIATLAAVPLTYLDSEMPSLALFYLFLVMAIMPVGNLIGSRWRNQHTMSRHYLLSLPAPRLKLFRLIQLRMIVFQGPLLLMAAYLVFTDKKMNLQFSVLQKTGFFAMVLILSNWFTNMTIAHSIGYESISSHQDQSRRLKLSLKMFARMVIEISAMVAAFFVLTTYLRASAIFAVLPLTILIAFFRYKHARESWLLS